MSRFNMSGLFARTLRVSVVALVVGGGVTVAAAPITQATTPQATTPTLQDRVTFGLDTSTVVRKYDLHVKVTGRTEVTLTGTVATEAQKSEAARLAKIAGATNIHNEIIVDRTIDASMADKVKAGLSKTGDTITDVWITAKVKWFYWGDDRLKGSHITVTTTDRVVTLTGTVPTAAGRTRAVALATSTEGVRKVVDQLKIGTK